MPSCPDCGETKMKKHAPFYVCTRCGLSFKPTEIQQAKDRARRELQQLMKGNSPDESQERKKRKLRDYRRWFEGREE
ncbi:MAG: hypothetical protein D6732_23110 [Methanobacteriota archaeon]|nr:MAG: hypothetical protein D6732_23110 [Euryarchaeota archaeon]